MEVKQIEMSAPVKFIMTEKEEIVNEKKKDIYERIKDQIKLDGFRQGTVPQEVAEKKMDLMELYKEIIDKMVIEVQAQYDIVSFDNFRVYSNAFKKGDLKIEFIGETRPKIRKIANLSEVEVKYNENDFKVTEEDLNSAIELGVKEKSVVEPTDKTVLQNLDIAIIDFTGYLGDSKDPFKGGSAKNHQICVNEIVNGQHQFIDNFEDQLVGMIVGETKSINVKFPEDYRDKTKSGKSVRFVVTLNAIKKITKPNLEELAKLKGFETVDEYKKQLEKTVSIGKKNNYDNEFKRTVVNAVVQSSEISPIPSGMFSNEMDKEWDRYLNRMGKSEKDMLKENPHAKEYFKLNNEPGINETIKLGIVLNEIALLNKLDVSKDEVIEYVKEMSDSMGHKEERKQKLIKDFETNQAQYEFMNKAAKNEKTVKFLFEYFKAKNGSK